MESKLMRPPLSVTKNLLLIVSLALGGITPALAAQAGTVSHLSGLLFAQKTDGTAKALSIGSAVDEGDTLITQEGAFARIKLKDEAELVLRPNSQLQIRQYIYDQTKPQADSAVMRLLKGSLRTVTGWISKRSSHDAYRMETPTATIGIRGTDYDASYCDDAASCGLKPGSPPPSPQGLPNQEGGPMGNSEPPLQPPPAAPTQFDEGLHVQTNSGSVSVGNGEGLVIIGPGQYAFVSGFNTPPVITTPTLPTNQLFTPPPSSVGIPGSPPGPTGGSLGLGQSCLVR